MAHISPDSEEMRLFAETFVAHVGDYTVELYHPDVSEVMDLRVTLADLLVAECEPPYKDMLKNATVTTWLDTVAVPALEDLCLQKYDERTRNAFFLRLTTQERRELTGQMLQILGLDLAAQMAMQGEETAGNES